MTPIVQTLEQFHAPPFGHVTYLKIYLLNYQPLSWTEIWQAVHDIYPNRWAIQLFPPVHDLINDAPIYHLWLLSEGWAPPSPMNLAHRFMPQQPKYSS